MNKIQVAKTIIKLAKALATDQKNSRTAGAKYTLTDKMEYFAGIIFTRVKYADGKLGGWIESEKNLQGNAKVLDESRIYGNAKVKDNAKVQGDSSVCDNAVVAGHAIVRNGGNVFRDAKVLDHAIVDNSMVFDVATVSQQAKITNGSEIYEHAIVTDQAIIDGSVVRNNAKVFGTARISNHSRICEKAQVSGTVNKSVIAGNCIIEGTVINSYLDGDRVVKKGEIIKDQKDFTLPSFFFR